MAPLVKLAIISETEGKASLVKNHLVFLPLLHILVEKQPCLLVPITFCKKPFIPYASPILTVFKISCETKQWIVSFKKPIIFGM